MNGDKDKNEVTFSVNDDDKDLLKSQWARGDFYDTWFLLSSKLREVEKKFNNIPCNWWGERFHS